MGVALGWCEYMTAKATPWQPCALQGQKLDPSSLDASLP